MGSGGGILYALKRVISCGSTRKRDKRNRSFKKWLERQSTDLDSSSAENVAVVPAAHSPVEEAKLVEAGDEQNRHAYSVALATAAAAEAAVAAANAAAEVVRLASASHNTGKTKEELAAIKIQTAFRGYLARRALRALKGLVRLKSLIGGQSVKRQSATTLRYMQTMARVQAEVRGRRIRMSEENLAFQRQIQQKCENELQNRRESIGENWDESIQTREQIEANFKNRQEAAVRRERALAYAYSHQQTWRNSTISAKQAFMDPNNPHWGWSWLERWMAVRPWENGSTTDKEPNSDRFSVKSSATRSISIYGDTKTHSPKAPKRSWPPSRQSPSTPNSKFSGKLRQPSPRGSATGKDEDSKSINSVQSDRCRRHSLAGSSVRDDESLASSPADFKRYMASTASTRAKSRLPSPLGVRKSETPEEVLGGSAKKRLSFLGSPPRPRRHSDPPEVVHQSYGHDC